MDTPIRVLAVCDTPLLAQPIEEACQADQGLQFLGTVWGPDELLDCRTPPQVILVSRQSADEDALSLIEEAATSLPRSATVVLAEREEVDFIQRALLVGARGFLLRPFTGAELCEGVRRIHRFEAERISRLAQGGEEELVSTPGEILAVFSPKGGVGCTTIATNLAVALHQGGQRVVLVDGSLQFGDIPVVLNIHARSSIVSLVDREQIDAELLARALVPHSSGVKVLLGPSELVEADAPYPEAVARVLTALQEQFDYVVVDTWPFIDDTTLTILDMADRILLVTTPEMAALRGVRLFLEMTDALGYPASKLLMVLNRCMSAFGIGAAEIEQNIRYKIGVNIPSDGQLVTRALNRGVPLMISDPTSRVARSIAQLAQLIVARAERPVPQGPKSAIRVSGLAQRLRALLASQ